ncbi:MAG: hypothetical protein U0487_03170 [Patescibacteria group bacterium]
MHVSQVSHERNKHRLPPVLESGDHDLVDTAGSRYHVVVIPHVDDALILPTVNGAVSIFDPHLCMSFETLPKDHEILEAAHRLCEASACEAKIGSTQLHSNFYCFERGHNNVTHNFHVFFAKAGKREAEGHQTFTRETLKGNPRVTEAWKDIFDQMDDLGLIEDKIRAIPESRLPAETPKKEKPSKPKRTSIPPAKHATKKPEEKMQATNPFSHPLLASGKPLSIIIPMFNGQAMLGGTVTVGARIWTVLDKSMCIESMHAGDDMIHATCHARLPFDFVELISHKPAKYGELPVNIYLAGLVDPSAVLERSAVHPATRGRRDPLLILRVIHDSITSFVFGELRTCCSALVPDGSESEQFPDFRIELIEGSMRGSYFAKY